MKKFIALLILIMFSVFTGFACFFLSVNTEDLEIIEHNGKYGFVNDKGKIVIDTQFENIRDFHEGLAAAKLYEKWGFINKKGQFIVQPQYSKVGDFSEGRAYVVHETEQRESDGYIHVHDYIAYINKKGKIVIPVYEGGPYFYDFSSGLAAKQYGDSTYCSYMDKNGKIILDSDYFEKTGWINTRDAGCHSFGEGLIEVYKYTDDTYEIRTSAYMNKKGEIVYSRNFRVPEEVEPLCDFDSFHEGMAIFRVNWKYGFINRNFEEVIPPVYDFAHSFKDGIALVEKDGKKFYIDKQGAFVKEYTSNF